jgi:L-seryl-tRNA(Ser) seleniumtransferase
VAYVGGGSLPDRSMPTWVVEVESPLSDSELSSTLRTGTPAVLPRVRGGKVVLDVRTVFEDQDDGLVAAVACAVTSCR